MFGRSKASSVPVEAESSGMRVFEVCGVGEWNPRIVVSATMAGAVALAGYGPEPRAVRCIGDVYAVDGVLLATALDGALGSAVVVVS